MSRRAPIGAGLTALLAMPGLALTAAVSGPASASTTSRTPTWHVEYRQAGTDITAVSATGPDNAWAIGISRRRGTGHGMRSAARGPANERGSVDRGVLAEGRVRGRGFNDAPGCVRDALGWRQVETFYEPGSRGACDWAASDDHGGLRLAGPVGPGIDFVHWTGRRFVTTRRFSPSPSFNTNGFLLAAVPHSSVAWIFGSYCRLPGACRDKGLIAELR